MKRVVLLLAIALCVTQAWAVQTTAIRIYAGTAGRSLSGLDTTTPSLTKTGAEYIVKDGSVVPKWGVNVTSTELSMGYSVYLIKETSYAAIVKTLGDWMTYNKFTTTYASSKYNDTGNANQMYYAYNAKNDPAGANKEVLQLNVAADPSDSLVAVFVYASADGKAQYNVIKYDPTVTEPYASYNGTASGNANSTGWENFAATIPEPTSGMLLLLGVAGLALKRKRA